MRSYMSIAVLLAAWFAPAAASAQHARAPALTAAYNATGGKLMRTLAAKAGDKPGNIVISPVSIGLAMSMAAHGARGATRDEMLRVLSTKDDGAAVADLMRALNSYDTPTAHLSVANALMIIRGDVVADYAGDLKRDYGAEIFRKADLTAINGWVKDKTQGGIGKILDQVSPNDVLVILNAAYFKANWVTAFDKKMTKDAAFWLAPETSEPVPTMLQTGTFKIAAGDGFRAVNLPYTADKIGMTIVVPDAVDGAGAVSARLDAKALTKLRTDIDHAQAKQVNLYLPKFKLSYDTGPLAASFQALGMKLPFDQEHADFSGIGPNLYISTILHRAAIEADEEGTQASAATAVIMAERAVKPQSDQPDVFRVDRPFLFYITDAATGAILFQGRVSDPRAS